MFKVFANGFFLDNAFGLSNGAPQGAIFGFPRPGLSTRPGRGTRNASWVPLGRFCLRFHQMNALGLDLVHVPV